MLTLEGDGVEWGALVGQQDAVAEKRGLVAEGLLGVQISLAVAALMGAVALGVRFIRRGARIVLDGGPESSSPLPGSPLL